LYKIYLNAVKLSEFVEKGEMFSASTHPEEKRV